MDSAIQQLLQQQLRLMELFTERLSTLQQTSQEMKLCTPDAESVRCSITEFHSDINVKSTFPNWFAHEDLFTVDLKEHAN